ncbi:ATP-binding protein [Umezawaea sp.]|uniref:ATP-binding protein n=1 Tax=Umezawaea sp. TaxID=1955258 RepID=UPI002ED1644F
MTTELALLSRVAYRGEEITRPRLRGLLALLAGDLRSGCGTARLVEGLWPDERPENPPKALQVLVSHARARLGSEVIVTTPVGYRLALGEDQVDASAILLRAAASARHARTGDHSSALDHAEAGLALWDGPAAWDADRHDPLSDLRAERASTFRSLVRSRALALARLGRRAEAAHPLTDLARERPRDEEVLAELLRCEAETLGPSTALARYETYRRALREELGSDPGPELRAVHERLLRGDAPAVRHRVPHDPNPLLGREADIAAVTGLLRTSRVTSIVGAGGLGKTRLAHAVSRRAEQRVVHFVALAGVTAESDVVAEVAAVLGGGESGLGQLGRPTAGRDVAAVVTALGGGPVLLVLDNCEHVVRGAAELVRALVAATEDVRVLTTGRAPLGLSSESVYPLPALSPSTAVELFRQRARAVRPGVDLPDAVVRELCGHLDGLPLAVELAAARVRVMSVTEVARRLDDRLGLLRGGARDSPERHRTLHAVIDWSWALLDPAARAAMRALSVFPGGFGADAARSVLGGDAVPVLERLVDQSLLAVSDDGTDARFRMLETVREFSAARLHEAGGADAATDRFLGWARDFGLAHHESLLGADLSRGLRLIRPEQDNLVRALRLGVDREDGPTVAATAAVLGSLWTIESNLTRMATLTGDPLRVLSHFRPDPEFVEVTRTAAVLSALTAYLLARGPSPLRALFVLRRLPPVAPTTPVRAVEAVLRATVDGGATAESLGEHGNRLVAGMADSTASYAREQANHLDAALVSARRMLAAFEHADTPWLRAVAHSRIGELCLRLDRGDEARQHFTAMLPVLEHLGTSTSAARVRWALVLANLQCGSFDEAERWLEQAVLDGEDDTLDVLMFDRGARAEIALARGDAEAGLDLWRRAVDRLRTTGLLDVPADEEPWPLEVQSAAVVAHAYGGAADRVADVVDRLPHALVALLDRRAGVSAMPFAEFPAHGAVLLALAVVRLDLAERSGDERAAAAGARMVALAERLRFPCGFQPTMSPARARRAARRADRRAYEDAVSTYARLDDSDLAEAVLAVLGTPATASDHA